IAAGARWLASREVRRRGDWARRRPGLAPGGFPFEFANDWYPDIDDTAEVVMALRRAGIGHDEATRGVTWMTGMQSGNGGWAAFDVDNTSRLPRRLPFCDFGEVTDPPSADVTAHVLEALALEGRIGTPAAHRGLEWLRSVQNDDGGFGEDLRSYREPEWRGRGASTASQTAWALLALEAAGIDD